MANIGPKKNKHITKKMFLDRLREENGNLYAAYTGLGLPYCRFQKWREEDQAFEDEIQKIKTKSIQYAESLMWKLMKEGNQKMIQFYLNTKGGYVTQKEVKAEVKAKDTVDVDLAITQIKEQITEKE